ncbi:MAG: hypothetical protein P9F19_08210 [Candidatus Contendobacter sp.]|nr:hypothetical protein [Candidatus Contendobacter sp.]MDG4557355.1 hypothetical protein [Candidatus Contendobacter sp.]
MTMTTTKKWAVVAAIGLLFGGVGASAWAEEGGVSFSTVAYTEVADASPEASGADNRARVAHADDPGADSYDPYTCAAAYGDGFCAAFERCMVAHGFRACYKRFTQ